jgi:hypothetical protein
MTGVREPFFTWYKRKPIAWVGTGVTAVGLGLGIGGAIGMGVTSSKADQHAEEIRAFAATDAATNYGANPPCGSTEVAGSDIAGYESACNTLRTDLADYDKNKIVTAVGWSLFGVGAIGTAVYTFIDWYSAKPPPPPATPETGAIRPRVLAVTPTVTTNYQGIGVVGTF